MADTDRKSAKIIRHLLKLPAASNAMDTKGRTPLFVATERGNTRCVRDLLQKGCRYNSNRHSEPLPLSSYQGYHDGVRTLIDNKAPVDSFSSTLLTPLHLACQEGHVDCVLLLLTRDANVNLAGEDGLTALHIACFYRQTDIIKILLDHKADVNMRSHSGSTPLLEICFKRVQI